MKTLQIKILLLAVLAQFLSLTASAEGRYHDKLRVHGSYYALFIRTDFISDTGGSVFLDVALQGPFRLNIGGNDRTGTVHFPHILQFPPDPSNDGTVAGAAVWLFDDGTTCIGNLSGPISRDGFRGRGRFACSDGSKLVVRVRDEEVIPGVSVTASINGKLILGEEDH